MYNKAMRLAILAIKVTLSAYLIFSVTGMSNFAFAGTPVSEYLCELGITFYKAGRCEDALSEFNKVLMLDPDNQTVKNYVNLIFNKDFSVFTEKERAALKEIATKAATEKPQGAEISKKGQGVKEQGVQVGQEIQPEPGAVSQETPSREAIIDNVLSSFSEGEIAAAAAATGTRAGQSKTQTVPTAITTATPPILEERLTRDEMIDNTFASLSGAGFEPGPAPTKEEFPQWDERFVEADKYKRPGPQMYGETQVRLGMTEKDIYWKRANWDLNEKNWRMLSNAALDRRENTYDPRIYDRLRLKITDEPETGTGFGFYSNLTVDPWSFTGKSEPLAVDSNFGDDADVVLKYWSNSGYTINQKVYSNRFGNTFSLPELKVSGERTNPGDGTNPVDVSGAFTPADTFHIPEGKIQRDFQPLREFWFDYKQDNLNLRLFPIAYENQALTFDDPLKLSNNHIWWEDSPWIRSWRHGIRNWGLVPVDFAKGYWDKSVSFFARDSEGQRLTSLRGFSFDFRPQEETSFLASVATPKDPWQDYGSADNLLSAMRLKHYITDNLNLGLTATNRLGYNVDDKGNLDATNYVLGTDLGYEVINGIMASFEVAHSRSRYDITDSQFRTESRGNAYYLSLQGRFPLQSIINTEYGYDGIKPEQGEDFFTKFRFFVSRMDESFDQPLSSYVETRDDESWSRHIHFRQPFKYYYQGEGKLLTWDDIKPYSIGNGIDIGRNTIGLRVESLLWDKKIDNLFDLRNVHSTDGKLVENVSREEIAWSINNRLTAKMLGIYHRLPKTKAGVDPFIFNTDTRRYFDNNQIEDEKDPSVTTGSLGLEYAFFEWLALNGIWEYTNDISLSYDNFPRGILNSGDNSWTYFEDENPYRGTRDWVYSQQYFPKPPYPYYNIFKSGLKITPSDKLDFYLDYTRNAYEKAGQVDDNMNHIGFEIAYRPMPKLAVFFRYTYSRWQDLDSLMQGITKVSGHQNIFTEFIYRPTEYDDFTFQYGEASRDPYMGGVLDIGWDPYGGSLRTIDTQHIFRLYYRRKF